MTACPDVLPRLERLLARRARLPALVLLLLAAVVCAGVGIDLTGAFARYGAASFRWTAYAPLAETVYSGGYTPITTTWLLSAPRVGVAMVALGAGAAGGAVTALFLGRRRRDSSSSPETN